jgi:hypothetical protein
LPQDDSSLWRNKISDFKSRGYFGEIDICHRQATAPPKICDSGTGNGIFFDIEMSGMRILAFERLSGDCFYGRACG